MKERIEMIQLTQSPVEPMITITSSEVLTGYHYVMTPESYETLSEVFGEPGDSDQAWAESHRGWLVQLFDASDFADFEYKVVSFFGNEQKTLAYMAIGSSLRNDAFEELERVYPEVALDKKTENSLDAMFGGGFAKKNSSAEDSEEQSVEDVIAYLRTVENTMLQGVFLSIFAKHVGDSSPLVVGTLYEYLLQALLRTNMLDPVGTEELISSIMMLFIEKMEG